MGIIAIGDIHGRTNWKKIVNNTSDKIVFIGDYFDSFDIKGVEQISNFKEIVKFKKENPNRVILLLGNHDYHYLSGVNARYSGYQGHLSFDIGEALDENKDILDICHVDGEYMFTHAGVTNTWYELAVREYAKKIGVGFDESMPISAISHLCFGDLKIDSIINNMFKDMPNLFGFGAVSNTRYNDPYGDNFHQTPIWVRPESLVLDFYKGYKHVVGHTTHYPPKITKNCIFIDGLEYGYYLEINGGTPTVKSI